jgi:hypothetical protein
MVSTSTVKEEQKQPLVIISFQAQLNLSKKDVGCLHADSLDGNKLEFGLNEVLTFKYLHSIRKCLHCCLMMIKMMMIVIMTMRQHKGKILNIFPQIAFTFNKRVTRWVIGLCTVLYRWVIG